MRLISRSRLALEDVPDNLLSKSAIISIDDPDCSRGRTRIDWSLPIAHLSLEFLDVVCPIPGVKAHLFDKEDAFSTLHFCRAVESRADYLIVQCDAGMSRSVAVVEALSGVWGLNYEHTMSEVYPNALVKSTILRVAETLGWCK